ncbi:MAG: hypothetical protein IRY90_01555, partial [Actinomadura rubrobrunea]|nr:hypothetical protein [Actinomadura rubrobrunea]
MEGRNAADNRTIGVEEELLLVDPDSGVPQAVSVDVIRYAYEKGEVPRGDRDPQAWSSGGESLETELQREQVEVCTRPCASLAELSAQIRWARRAAGPRPRGGGVGGGGG